MRRLLLAWLICLAFPAYAFDACAPDAAARYAPVAAQEEKTLLFIAEKCGAAPSYVFGTIHSGDPGILHSAAAAFDRARRVRKALFEITAGGDVAAQAQQAMFFPPDDRTTLSSLIGGAYFDALSRKLRPHGIDNERLERVRPWAAAIMLQLPDGDEGAVMDDLLQREAGKAQVAVAGLETPKEQFAIFGDLPMAAQIAFLKDTLDNIDAVEDMNDQLTAYYLAHDLRAIAALGKDSFDELADKKLAEHLKSALITERNRRMVRRMQPELARGNILVAVGALHLPGEDGILRALEKAGYFITPLPMEHPHAD